MTMTAIDYCLIVAVAVLASIAYRLKLKNRADYIEAGEAYESLSSRYVEVKESDEKLKSELRALLYIEEAYKALCEERDKLKDELKAARR